MLLNTISAFLLAENILLPDSLTKEAIQKVTRIAAYAEIPDFKFPRARWFVDILFQAGKYAVRFPSAIFHR